MCFNHSRLDTKIANNFANVKLWLLISPLILLLLFTLYFLFISKDANFVDKYILLQKNLFLYLNNRLSEYPILQLNLTQLGDAVISFSILSIFIISAPKIWEVLLTSGILSLIVSFTLKKLFSVPRPAAVFDNDSFEIIGRTLTGNTSLPSGHSISAFFVITIFLFAFMPKKKLNKLFWSFFMLIIGLVIAFSRVGVGAHYPIDVVIGGTIGYIIAIVSIKLNQKFKWLNWIGDKKYYLFFIILFIISFIQIIRKILETNLLIFYISLLFLFLTLFTLIKSYAKKN